MVLDPRQYPSGSAAEGATPIVFWKVITQTVTPAEVATVVGIDTQTFTVVGVKVGDVVICNPAATGEAVVVGAVRVTAADTVAITFINPTAGALTPDAGTYTFLIFRPEA